MEILKIDHLKKEFKDMTAVNGLDLTMQEKDVHGILGPNGAGKSTTINCILGLLGYEEGSVTFAGGESIRKWGKNIGYVPQDLAIYPDLTPTENIRFFCSLYGFKGKELEERVTKALDFVGLTDVKDKKSGEFSGGMKRRLNMACGIAHSPKLIIMDEPTVGIDPQSRNRILENVRTLNEQGATILYTTHYMPEIEEICNRITVIDHGALVATGTKEEIMNRMGTDQMMNLSFAEGKGDMDAFVAEASQIDGIHQTDPDGWNCKIRHDKKTVVLNKVIDAAIRSGLEIEHITNEEPSLEEIFLMLTGKELRDQK